MHGTGSHNHSDSDFRRAESLAAARRPGCTESRQSQARAILRLAAAHLQPAAMIARLVRLAAARPGLRPAAAICPPHWQQVGRPGLHSESSPVSESQLPWERQPEPGSRVTRRAHGSSTAASRYTGTPGPLARQCHHGADDKGAEARRRAPGPPALGPSAWARRHHTARFQHGPAFRVTRARRSQGRPAWSLAAARRRAAARLRLPSPPSPTLAAADPALAAGRHQASLTTARAAARLLWPLRAAAARAGGAVSTLLPPSARPVGGPRPGSRVSTPGLGGEQSSRSQVGLPSRSPSHSKRRRASATGP